MVKSMTGFGRGQYSDEKRTVTVEIKSVNHRYSDITVKMPRRYQFAEDAVKNMVKTVAPRGKIDVGIMVETAESDDTNVSLNLSLAKQYYECFKSLKASMPDLNGDVDFRLVATQPEVIRSAADVENEEEVLNAFKKATEAALVEFDHMRCVEGAKLADDILYRNGLIAKTRDEIAAYVPNVVKTYTAKMKDRIQELLGDSAVIPEDRILLEAAVFADKSDITEELVRLKSHTEHLIQLMNTKGEPAGKKLDFLVQEMNRESNTIGSKANDINITNNVLVLKAEIEKIREQVQNIE